MFQLKHGRYALGTQSLLGCLRQNVQFLQSALMLHVFLIQISVVYAEPCIVSLTPSSDQGLGLTEGHISLLFVLFMDAESALSLLRKVDISSSYALIFAASVVGRVFLIASLRVGAYPESFPNTASLSIFGGRTTDPMSLTP